MSMKKLLRRATRTRKQKSLVERMSEAEARQVLTNMELSFEPMTAEQKQAVEIMKKQEETLC